MNASRNVADMQTVYAALQRVKRAADALTTPVEHMRVDHGGANIPVAEQLLDSTDVVACLQQMGSERMPEGVASYVLDDTRPGGSILHGPLNQGLVNVMPSLFSCPWVLPAVGLREHPLPTPVGRRVRGLPVRGGRQHNPVPAIGEIGVVGDLH